MNLYEFSQQNNNEMGIYMTKAEDEELYNATLDEVQRLLTISDEIRVTVKKVSADTPPKTEKKVIEPKLQTNKQSKIETGFCIRTGIPIPFNIEKPLCYEAFKSWNKYGDPDYEEKFCHFSGEPTYGATSVSRPVLNKNWKKAKQLFEF